MEKVAVLDVEEKGPKNSDALIVDDNKLHAEALSGERPVTLQDQKDPKQKSELPGLQIVDTKNEAHPAQQNQVRPESNVAKAVASEAHEKSHLGGIINGVINFDVDKLVAPLVDAGTKQANEKKELLAAELRLAEEILKTGKIPEDMKGLYNFMELPKAVMRDKEINEILKSLGSTKQIEVTHLLGPINSTANYKVELTDNGVVLDKDRMTVSYLDWIHRKASDK